MLAPAMYRTSIAYVLSCCWLRLWLVREKCIVVAGGPSIIGGSVLNWNRTESILSCEVFQCTYVKIDRFSSVA